MVVGDPGEDMLAGGESGADGSMALALVLVVFVNSTTGCKLSTYSNTYY